MITCLPHGGRIVTGGGGSFSRRPALAVLVAVCGAAISTLAAAPSVAAPVAPAEDASPVAAVVVQPPTPLPGTTPLLRQPSGTPAPAPSPSSSSTPTPSASRSGSFPASPSAPPSTAPTPPSSAPSPAPSSGGPGTTPPREGEEDGCGLVDVGCRINSWFRGLVRGAINPVIKGLGTTVLTSPHVERQERVRQLWATSAWIANSCYVLVVLAAGIMLMAHGSVQTSYTLKETAPRLVVGMVAGNTSLAWIGQAIDAANGLSGALMGQGVPVDEAAQRLTELLVEILVAALTGRGPLLVVLVALAAIVLALVLLGIYFVRIMLLTLLAAAAPLALACHALPHTEALARLWWRALAAVLAVQVAQALVLITTLQIFFSPDRSVLFGAAPDQTLRDLALIICLLYILIRIPAWISRLVFRGGLRSSPPYRVARTIAAITIFRSVFGGARSPAPGRWRPPP